MKLVIISDTHNKHDELVLPAGDVLIHCGDATVSGKPWELFPFLNWLAQQPHRTKIFVPGNHDFDVQKNESLYINLCREQGIYLLRDRALVLDGVKFYGSPWVPNLEGWAYYGDHLTLVGRFSRIPADTQVLITHGPAMELAMGVAHFGSVVLQQRLSELDALKVHCFGHIHESYGQHYDGNGGLISVNASNCNIDYDLVNAPLVVEVTSDQR